MGLVVLRVSVLRSIDPTTHMSDELETACCTAHYYHNPLVLWSSSSRASSPTRQSEYATRSIGPMAHWSYDPIVRLLVGPTHQRIVAVQAVRTIGSMTHWSYGLIFRQPIGHIHCTTNNTNLHWYLSEQWTWFCDHLVVQPIGPTAYWS